MNGFNRINFFAAVWGIGLGAFITASLYGLGSAFSLAGMIAIGTFVNACIVTYIGYGQHTISIAAKDLAATKLRADLFDRRFAVFQATQKVLSKVFADAACDYSDVHQFTPWTQQAYFLFDDSVHEYLLDIRTRLIDIASANFKMKDVVDTLERHDAITKNHESLSWIVEQLNMDKDGLFSKFRLYLRH